MKYYICKIQFSKLHVILKHYLRIHMYIRKRLSMQLIYLTNRKFRLKCSNHVFTRQSNSWGAFGNVLWE
jgi:hypothetical protein